jgi:AraC family transcriptional regulator
MDSKSLQPAIAPAESPAPRGGIRPYVLARVIKLIESRLQEPLLVEDLAREACLSPFHFSRMFKQATGKSPHAYLIGRRLEVARELLATTELAIRDVGKRAGFSTHAHFCSVFRSHCGTTPAAYRRQHRAMAGGGTEVAARAATLGMWEKSPA